MIYSSVCCLFAKCSRMDRKRKYNKRYRWKRMLGDDDWMRSRKKWTKHTLYSIKHELFLFLYHYLKHCVGGSSVSILFISITFCISFMQFPRVLFDRNAPCEQNVSLFICSINHRCIQMMFGNTMCKCSKSTQQRDRDAKPNKLS